jgi:hypothetical protein
MEDIYVTTKGLHLYLGMVDTLKLNDLINKFDRFCDM